MRILIVDDEPPARSRLLALVEEAALGQVVGEAANGHEALRLAEEAAADLILLDIRMPGMDGVEVARHLARFAHPPAVVFTTAYDDRALEAIDANAVAYLLKPIRRERLREAIARAQIPTKAQLANLGASSAHLASARTHVSAHSQGGVSLLPVADVRYFRAEHKYVTARHPEGELVIEDSLSALESEFGDAFVRVHRNALASLRHLRGLQRGRDDKLVVVFAGVEDELEVSRRLASQVRRALKKVARAG